MKVSTGDFFSPEEMENHPDLMKMKIAMKLLMELYAKIRLQLGLTDHQTLDVAMNFHACYCAEAIKSLGLPESYLETFKKQFEEGLNLHYNAAQGVTVEEMRNPV
jgi:hypothetical protein